jgi:hypothetical protein
MLAVHNLLPCEGVWLIKLAKTYFINFPSQIYCMLSTRRWKKPTYPPLKSSVGKARENHGQVTTGLDHYAINTSLF